MSNQSVNIRSAVVARPGYWLLDRDWRQIEFRISAYAAGEQSLIEGFKNNADYYRMIFQRMSIARGTPIELQQISDKQRQLGKVIALGQSYGQEAGGLAQKLNIPYDQARDIMDSYWAGLPATTRAKDEALKKAFRDGGIHTWFGRWRPLPTLRSSDKREKAKAIRSVWNTFVQGTAADILKIAMVRAFKALQGHDVHQLLNVHDELLWEVHESEPFEEIDEITRQSMEFAIAQLGTFPTDAEYGYSWGELMDRKDFLEKYGSKLNLKGTSVMSAPLNAPVQNLLPTVQTSPTPVPTNGATHPENVLVNTPEVQVATLAQVGDNTTHAQAAPAPLAVQLIPGNTTPTQPVKDGYSYPCVMILGVEQLTQKQCEFLRKLSENFKGEYQLYLQYQNQLLRMPDTLKVSPVPQFIQYLQRAFGDRVKLELFDAAGKPLPKAVLFV